MPVRFHKLKKSSRDDSLKPIAIPFGPDTLTVTYSRAKYTPEFEKKFKALQNEGMPLNALSRLIAALVEDWDVVDEIDTVENFSLPSNEREFFKVPCNAGTLEAFGAPILEKIVEKLSEDNSPKKKTLQTTEDF